MEFLEEGVLEREGLVWLGGKRDGYKPWPEANDILSRTYTPESMARLEESGWSISWRSGSLTLSIDAANAARERDALKRLQESAGTTDEIRGIYAVSGNLCSGGFVTKYLF